MATRTPFYSPHINHFVKQPNNRVQFFHYNPMATQGNLPIIVSRIGIIGAGVSGLAVAKQLSHYNPIVFEATNSIGGVWRHCSSRCTKLQSQTWNYEFSDFPWPKRESTDYPSHAEILEYLHTYAVHFDLFKYVIFNTKVVEMKFVRDKEGFDFGRLPNDHGNPLPSRPVWELSVQTNESDAIQVFYNFLTHKLTSNSSLTILNSIIEKIIMMMKFAITI